MARESDLPSIEEILYGILKVKINFNNDQNHDEDGSFYHIFHMLLFENGK